MTWLDFVMEEWLLVSILAVLVAAFLTFEKRKGGNSISHHDATRRVNKGEAVVLDVREAGEYKAGHIVDAINIPYKKLGEQIDQLKKYQDKEIIVVDKMGQHAGAAGKLLRDNGFQVVRLQGGIVEWTQQNLPLIKA